MCAMPYTGIAHLESRQVGVVSLITVTQLSDEIEAVELHEDLWHS